MGSSFWGDPKSDLFLGCRCSNCKLFVPLGGASEKKRGNKTTELGNFLFSRIELGLTTGEPAEQQPDQKEVFQFESSCRARTDPLLSGVVPTLSHHLYLPQSNTFNPTPLSVECMPNDENFSEGISTVFKVRHKGIRLDIMCYSLSSRPLDPRFLCPSHRQKMPTGVHAFSSTRATGSLECEGALRCCNAFSRCCSL